MNAKALIVWGYIIELLAATLIYAVLWMLFGGSALASFLSDSWFAWSTLCGLIFAIAGSLFVILFQMSASDFGGYLAYRKADGKYRRAFGIAITISFLATVSFVVSGTTNVIWVAHVSGFLLLLCCINLYSMFKNASDLMKMHTLFVRKKREFEREQNETRDGSR